MDVGAIAVGTLAFVLALEASFLWFYPWQVGVGVLALGLCLGLSVKGRSPLLYCCLVFALLWICHMHWLAAQPVADTQLRDYGLQQKQDLSNPLEVRMAWDVLSTCPAKFTAPPGKLIIEVRALVKDAYFSLKAPELSGVTAETFYQRHCI
ncbi:hypothetical protein [Comamonas thiooxydans]|uniref:hypothetical protein n=1 Tax=Comamonas thiooxydans TaxID=363952 RepID=UPI001186BE2E|nr:hypothetical protein [Comamonas thiooxydans]